MPHYSGTGIAARRRRRPASFEIERLEQRLLLATQPPLAGRIAEQNDRTLAAADTDLYDYGAAQSGLMTVELFFLNSRGNLDVEVRDAQNAVLGAGSGAGDGERLDLLATAGEPSRFVGSPLNDAYSSTANRTTCPTRPTMYCRPSRQVRVGLLLSGGLE